MSNTYAYPSCGHIKQLQHRLKQSSKTHEQTVTNYMQLIKEIANELIILGEKMDPEDITDIILHGLNHKSYKPIHDCDTPSLFHELHERKLFRSTFEMQDDNRDGVNDEQNNNFCGALVEEVSSELDYTAKCDKGCVS